MWTDAPGDQPVTAAPPLPPITRRTRGYETLSSFAANFASSIKTTKPGDVLAIAGEQTKLLAQYYEEALHEAQRAFWMAAITGVVGIVFFVGAVILLLHGIGGGVTTVSVLAGAIAEVISGVSLSIYAGARRQLFAFLQVLEQMQRFLLAHEMCNSLTGEARAAAFAKVIDMVAGGASTTAHWSRLPGPGKPE